MIKLNLHNISSYLLNIGVCREKNIELTKIYWKSSQEIILRLRLTSGCQIIVKQHHRHNDRGTNIIKNEWQLHQFLHSCSDLIYTSSLNLEILHFDEMNSILSYKLPEGYIDLESYYTNQNVFSIKIAEVVGMSLAVLHRETIDSRNCFDFMNKIVDDKPGYQFFYPNYLLNRLAPETLFTEFSITSFRFLDFYQRSESLKAAITELVVNYSHCCLTHNNLHLDNILIPTQWEIISPQNKVFNRAVIKLFNWERCSWGDPAFDLGTAIANYLILWLNSLTLFPGIELDKSLQLATIPLEFIQPSIIALTKAYISNFEMILQIRPSFIKQVIQFTALSLIYKIIESIEVTHSFNSQLIVTLQVAKTMLCQPKNSFMTIFGLINLDEIGLKEENIN